MSFFEKQKLQDIGLERGYPNICSDTISLHPSRNAALVKLYRFLERHYTGTDPTIPVKEFSFRSHIHIPPYDNNDTGYFRFYDAGSDKTIIVVPQRRGSYGYNFARLTASYLASNGFNVYEIVTPFHERRLPDGVTSVVNLPADIETLKLTSKQAIEEILALIDFIGKDSIGIVGISQGAAYATIVSGLEKKIKRSVYIHGFGDVADLLLNTNERFARHFREQNKALTIQEDALNSLKQDLRDIEPLTYAKGISTYDAIMINAKNDDSLPEANVIALWEALGRPRLYYLSGGHLSIALHIKKILRMTLQHLKRNLK